MGHLVVNYPAIADTDLVFDAHETRQILQFFYPSYSSRIATLTIANDARRLAQTMLIGAVDASINMSYVKAMVLSLRFLPGKRVASWAKKLARGLTKQWFKNATQNDLLNAEIYDAVRKTVARNFATEFQALLNGLSIARMNLPRRVSELVPGISSARLG